LSFLSDAVGFEGMPLIGEWFSLEPRMDTDFLLRELRALRGEKKDLGDRDLPRRVQSAF